MGTWGTGPFDNDKAADFSYTLDEAAVGEREQVLRGVLVRTIEAVGYLDEADEAVAAAALIAAQCPGGRPITTAYGPKRPVPAIGDDARALAAAALDRVTADESELVESWGDPADARQWLSMIKSLRDVLVPPPVAHDVPLFDI